MTPEIWLGILALIATVLLGTLQILQANRNFRQQMLLEDRRLSLERREDEVIRQDRPTSTADIVLMDRQRQDIMTSIALSQARQSLSFAQFSGLGGAVSLLLSAAFVFVVAPDGTTTIAAAALGLAGAGLSGFIGRLYIKAYADQINQINNVVLNQVGDQTPQQLELLERAMGQLPDGGGFGGRRPGSTGG